MKKVISSFIFGGVIGVIIALLFTPRSGEEIRQMLTDKFEDIKENALRSIREGQEITQTTLQQAQTRIAEQRNRTDVA